ncbi:hypothetical protein D3C86_1800750 [compost metagenome]
MVPNPFSEGHLLFVPSRQFPDLLVHAAGFDLQFLHLFRSEPFFSAGQDQAEPGKLVQRRQHQVVLDGGFHD